ncbi:MAG TPA: oxidoreductase [Prolixibacteraceae bacterium]|nr:oxidoreductase [Prolixibacteraceae bacterium]
MSKTLNVGIIGFGLSGRYFFSPFIENHRYMEIYAIVSSQVEEISQSYPKAKIYDNVSLLFSDPEIDLVVVASPNDTHFEYAKKALQNGKHVIVEKPFSVSSAQASELIALSNKMKLVLAPFHNRRWDGDFLTLQKIINEGKLGEIIEFESHFDRYRPLYERVEWKSIPFKGNGILYDLGPHLIDQAICLFGKPKALFAHITTHRKNSRTDDYFDIHLYYSLHKVILKAGVFVKETGPRFTLHGRNGSFVKYGLDPQENNLRHGMKPDNQLLGKDNEDLYALLNYEVEGMSFREKIETIDGCYSQYFENVYNTIKNNEELAVSPNDAALVIQIIELACRSNSEKRIIEL